MAEKMLTTAISDYGAAVKQRLSSPAIAGAPEDQLRGPLETLVQAAGEACAFRAVNLIGETSLADIRSRPDFAVTVNKALTGFIEGESAGKRRRPAPLHGRTRQKAVQQSATW